MPLSNRIYSPEELAVARKMEKNLLAEKNSKFSVYTKKTGKGFFAYFFLDNSIEPSIFGYYPSGAELQAEIELLKSGKDGQNHDK